MNSTSICMATCRSECMETCWNIVKFLELTDKIQCLAFDLAHSLRERKGSGGKAGIVQGFRNFRCLLRKDCLDVSGRSLTAYSGYSNP